MADNVKKDKEISELKIKNQGLLADLEETEHYCKTLRKELNALKQKNLKCHSNY